MLSNLGGQATAPRYTGHNGAWKTGCIGSWMVVFHNDLMRLRTQNGPANMAVMRHTAMNIFKGMGDKNSLKNRRKSAA